MYRSHFPRRDLIRTPYSDVLYKELWEKALYDSKDLKIALHEESYDLGKEYIDLINHAALICQVTIKSSDIDYSHGFLLVSLIKKIKRDSNLRDFRYLETGTARGFSAVVVAKVAQDLFQDYRVTTIDVLQHETKRYWNSIGDSKGRRSRPELLEPYRDLLPRINFLTTRAVRYMREHESERFHLVFLDAQHTHKDVRREFNWVAKKQKSGDVIFIDDVTEGQFDGICKFVREAKMDTRYREILIDFQPARTKGFAAFEKV
jgi:predicted O-methyltransferase YrrM